MEPTIQAKPSLTRRREQDDPELNPNTVRPFGRFGVGTVTAHPVGLVVAIGVILIACFALPEAVALLALSLPAGALFGFLLWLRHRNRGF